MSYQQRTFISTLLFLLFFANSTNTLFGQSANYVYYVPLPETQLHNNLKTFVAYKRQRIGSQMRSIISITASEDNTVVYYDHWEDGFEADINNPVQPSTQVWNLNSGDVMPLDNTVNLPRNPAQIRYDGNDKIVATEFLAVTRAGYAVNPGPVLSGAVEVLDTTAYDTYYELPIGEDISSSDMFEHISLYVTANQDATQLNIDTDGNGTVDITTTISQGETYYKNGGFDVGASVTADKPIHAHIVTGDLGGYYEARFYTLYAKNLWDNHYYSPVGTTTSSDPVHIFLYNPQPSTITINYMTLNGTGSFNVAAGSVYRFPMPLRSGAYFYTNDDNDMFFALGAIDADHRNNQAHDWGFSLLPESYLTGSAVVGWGPGSGNLLYNGSPVWVMGIKNTTFYVDFDNNPNTGVNTDPLGGKYDIAYNVAPFQSVQIYDTDRDQTGMRVYTTDGCLIAAMYGQDPATARPGNPFLDLGTSIPPHRNVTVTKSAVISLDNDGDGLLDIGDEVIYSISIANMTVYTQEQVTITDNLPAGVTYIANSTTHNNTPITDDGTGTPFPLDGSGYLLGDLASGSEDTVTFSVTVTGLPSATITNLATVTSTTDSWDAQVISPVDIGSITACNLSFTDVTGTDQAGYAENASICVTLNDNDANRDNGVAESFSILIRNTSTGDREAITLTETGVNTGIFRGCINSSASTGQAEEDGLLYATGGDNLSTTYTDAIFGDQCSDVAVISPTTFTKQLYLTDPGQSLDRIDPVASVDLTTDTIEWTASGLTFSQAPTMAGTFTMETAGTVTVTIYVSGNPGAGATAALSIDDGAAFLTLSSPVYDAGAGTVTWTGTIPSTTTVNSGQAIDLTLSGISPTGISTGMVKSHQKISDSAGGFTGVLSNEDRIGRAVANIGDLDGDGVTDLAVGTAGDDDGGLGRGAIWMLFMNGDGTVKSHQKISDTQGGFTGVLDNADAFGTSIANLGDLDGDGITDIAVGARADDDGGTSNGAIWILFLNSNGTVKSHQKISDTQGGFTGGLTSDLFGTSVSNLGDGDGDGITDIAVGAPSDNDGGTNNGAVWILFLNSNGTVKSHQKISDTQGNFAGVLGDGFFGESVSNLGDVDGDGVPDIVVGESSDDDGGSSRGAVWVLFLNSDGTVKSHQKISDTQGGFMGGLTDGGRFGESVTNLGDLDGDNITDIAVGAFREYNGGGEGAVWILFLNSDGTVKSEQKISAVDGGFTGTLGADEFATSLANLGDLDGDGITDIAVGATLDDDGGLNRGAVWILFLDAKVVKSHQKISDTEGGFIGVLDNSDNFSQKMANIGDLDGDGITDLAVGAPRDDDGGSGRGAVWVLFLNSDGTVKSHQKISDTQGGFTGVLNDEDRFGASIAKLGDLDGDGIIDLAVGAFGNDEGGNNHGAVWVLFMNSNGTVKSHQKISDTQGGFTGVLGTGYLGYSCSSLGDLDEDGVIDLVVGEYRDDDGGAERGAVWILFLNSDGTVKSHQKISDTQGGFTGILDDFDFFGSDVSNIGDLDGDGITDLVVGAFGDDDGNFDRGAVWVLFLNNDGTVKSHQKISDTQGGFTGILDDGGHFGSSFAKLDDLDGDGITDLAVGAFEDSDGGTERGAIWILYLNGDGTVKSHQKISDTQGNFTGVLDNADVFGVSLTNLGDMDGDGVTDLAVGATQDDDGGLSRGAVWILFLDATVTAGGGGVDVYFDSNTNPSRIDLPTTTVIAIDDFSIYDAPYAGGSTILSSVGGDTVYIRTTVSDPFGAYDISSLDLNLTGPGISPTNVVLTETDVVATSGASKTYEYAWLAPVVEGDYTIRAIAHEGLENTVADTAFTELNISFNDFGSPATLTFIDVSNVDTEVYTPNETICLQLQEGDKNIDSTAVDMITVTVTSSSGDNETVTLTETDVNTGVFRGCITTSTTPGATNDGTFNAAAGDALSATYTDPNDPTDTSTDNAVVTSPNPTISILNTLAIPTDGSAQIGDPIQFDIVVSNTGPTAMNVVNVNYTFENDFITYSSAGIAPSATSANTLSWANVGPLAAGESIVIPVHFTATSTDLDVLTFASVSGTDENSVMVADGPSQAQVAITRPELTLSKNLIAPLSGTHRIGDTLSYEIIITNTGSTDISILPLSDFYSAGCLELVDAVATAPDAIGSGNLLWSNLGPLATSASINLTARFRVVGTCLPVDNTVNISFAQDVFGDIVPAVEDIESVSTCPRGFTLQGGICVPDNDEDGIPDSDDLDDDNDGILDTDELTTTTSNVTLTEAGDCSATNLNYNHLISFSAGTTDSDTDVTISFELSGDYGSSGTEHIDVTGEGGTNLGAYNITNSDNTAYPDCGATPMNISFTITQAQWNLWNDDGQVDLTFIPDASVNFSCSGHYSCLGNVSASFIITNMVEADTDNDGMIDRLDLDSDNDGCPDAIEGGGSFTTSDIQNDTLTGGVDTNGIPLVAGPSGQGVGSSQDVNTQDIECPCLNDNDGDLICDIDDLDDDNDGILDEDENPCTYVQSGTWTSSGTTADGAAGALMINMTSIEFSGGNTNHTYSPNGTFNATNYWSNPAVAGANSLQFLFYWDTSAELATERADDDGGTRQITINFSEPLYSTILHIDRLGGYGSTNPGTNTAFSNSSEWTLTTPTVSMTRLSGNTQFVVNGNKFYREPDIDLGTAIPSSEPNNTTGAASGSIQINTNGAPFTSITFSVAGIGVEGNGIDGVEFIFESCEAIDTDNDGTPDYLDLDSDEDGCPDAIEGGGSFTASDIQNDTLTGGVDANGIPLIAGPTGQGTGDSQNAGVQSPDCPISCTINTAVWLEGAYDLAGDSMPPLLNNQGLLPGQRPTFFLGTQTSPGHPYKQTPWNHNSTDLDDYNYNTVGDDRAGYSVSAVDPILISLRTGLNYSTTICTLIGILNTDGTITFPNDCNCTITDGQQVYIVIEHRNHLPVMSDTMITVTGGVITHDFRNRESYKSFTGDGQKEIKPGVFAMFAANGDGINASGSRTDINATDESIWTSQNSSGDIYIYGDHNLSGDTNGNDESLWLSNTGKASDIDFNN